MIAGPKFEGLGGLLSLVYPSLCTVCRVDTRAAEYLCDQCETKTVRIVSPLRYLVACWLTAALDDKKSAGCDSMLSFQCPCIRLGSENSGLDQASLLAELLSKQMSIQYQSWLERVRYATTQTALDRAERTENLHNAFRLRKNVDVRPLRVLLIDDVLTTGSTLSECARILKRAGALSVHAATAARA